MKFLTLMCPSLAASQLLTDVVNADTELSVDDGSRHLRGDKHSKPVAVSAEAIAD